MFFRKKSSIILGALVILSFVATGLAQNGTPTQRLDVLRQKLETMRRSLGSTISVLRDEAKDTKDSNIDKASLETPQVRLRSLEKEVSSLNSDMNSLRGKIDRSEKYEQSDIDQLETAVADLQKRVDSTLLETSRLRSNPETNVGKARTPKREKKKFLKIIPIGTKVDEYEELIGNVTPGRDRELFIVATREVRRGKHEVGRLLFQTIITTYPDSQYLPMAKLAIADSFYIEGGTSNLIQSAAGYQDWLTFFPTHPLADRVLLKIAESEMRQIGLPDRDVTRAKKAEQRLKALLQNYPDSLLRSQVEQRLGQVQDNIGLHDLHIANYYYKLSVDQKKGGLKGAQSRLLEITEKYPNFTYLDDVLWKLGVTYQIEEETDQAARYFQRLVADYPESEYTEKAKEQLQLMGSPIPEPNPNRINAMTQEKVSFFTNFKNQFLGIYPMTIDKNGVLMTNDFDKTKFELIDQVIENQGDLAASQIPKALTTIVSERPQ